MLYTSAHISLAFLELLVNVDAAQLQDAYKIIQIKINPEANFHQIKKEDLPVNWRASNEMDAMQVLGTNWLLQNQSLVLEVPSVVIPYESNFLINPLHPDINLVVIKEIISLDIDQRFF